MTQRPHKIVDNSHEHQCYKCGGIGYLDEDNPKKPYTKIKLTKCPTCKGTGIWMEEHYHLITTDEKGNKICFDVDNLGK